MTVSQLLIGLLFFFAIATVLIGKKVIPARGFAYGLVLILAVGYGFMLQAEDKANGVVYTHWAESPAIQLPMIAFGVGALLFLLYKFIRPTIRVEE